MFLQDEIPQTVFLNPSTLLSKDGFTIVHTLPSIIENKITRSNPQTQI
jgi:hypothetical protein